MFTMGVVAYALSGAIASITLLGNLFVEDARAQAIPARTEKNANARKSVAVTVASHRPSDKLPQPRRQRYSRTTGQKAQHRSTIHNEESPQGTRAHLGTFFVTAYTHHHDRQGEPNKTATGTLPQADRTVAVDPRVIPLGSRIYIAGVGERIAEDTGGKIKGKKLDLFLPSTLACLRFGVRKHEVHLIVKD